MAGWRLETPVAFLIFRRPETTARVFEEIRRARPRKLLVVADGPRPEVPGEEERCAATRAIAEQVDWPCEVLSNYAEENMGCKRRVSSGLDWVFGEVEEAIILEDDCLPHPSFFRFCEELLDRYRDEERVMHISGDNFQSRRRRWAPGELLHRRRGRADQGASYYFSRYPHIWGWASWRRAWTNNDVGMRAWLATEDKSSYLHQFSDPGEQAFWRQAWDAVSRGQQDTWDYQWAFACLAFEGLSIMPSANLVSNIGFGEGGVHTVEGNLKLENLPVEDVGFPLRHPAVLERDIEADAHTGRLFFRARGSAAHRIRDLLSRLLPRPVKAGVMRVAWAVKRAVDRLVGIGNDAGGVRAGEETREPANPDHGDHYWGFMSHSQEGEDMILNYLLDHQSAGLYVDVGAHHPTTFSNTRHFYGLGWHGINIDADPAAINALARERPRDINLNVGVGEEEGEFDFVRYFEPALNTFDQDTVEQRLEDGIPYDISHVTKIPVRRLEHILVEHLPDGERIDFLSVDVEGKDLEVLRSNNWVAFRPRFVVVEAIDVQDPAEANESETVQFLASQGYSPVAKTANTLILRDRSNDERTAGSVDDDA